MDLSELEITAAMARIALGDGDAQRLGAEVERMLEHFETMRSFEESAAPHQPGDLRPNVLREDVAPAEDAAARVALASALMDQAPDLESGLVTIPNVL
jgi:Asp-tRNA(Asn)/Glu-tRNA(Gln) amidotransferase C subunit